MKPSEILSLSDDDLLGLLTRSRNAYYNSNEESVNDDILHDDVYDALIDALVFRYPNHPFLSEVGANPITSPTYGTVVPLEFWMGSMKKMLDDKAISNWSSKQTSKNYAISDKLDGVSAMLRYNTHGKPSLFTRGNGLMGHDISHLLQYIRLLPSSSSSSSSSKKEKEKEKVKVKDCGIRGELLFSKTDWSETLHEFGSNPLSVLAGTVNAKTPNPKIASHIEFIAHELVHPGGQKPTTQWKSLIQLGFSVVPHDILTVTDLNVKRLTEILVDRRNNGSYNMDGLIIADDSPHERVTSGNPSYAFAFKSNATMEQAETVVTRIIWKISKDGFIKPTVEFESVAIKGFNISKASGFNAKYIKDNVLGVGSRIVVIRSGDVIPTITQFLSASSTHKPDFPEDVEWIWNSTNVDICINSETPNDTHIKRQLHYFVSSLETKGVGECVINKIYNGGCHTLVQLYNLTPEDLVKLDGIQAVSANKIHRALHEAIGRASVYLLMVASSTLGRGVGERKLKTIIDVLPDMADPKKRYIPVMSALVDIPGIDERTATPIRTGLKDFWILYDTLKEFITVVPVTPLTANVSSSSKFLSKEILVFTGFRDKDLETQLVNAGATIASSVTKNVTKVIIKDDSGRESTKGKAATAKGIPILLLEDFMTFLQLAHH
jgi:DNA ligase (NAD+)